jgi:RNA polymerase sigma factor (sigma-70 family)
LVRTNEGLVYSVARRYAKAHGLLDVDDLVQHGRLGLLVAIRRFDPERGCQLGTFAIHWIR